MGRLRIADLPMLGACPSLLASFDIAERMAKHGKGRNMGKYLRGNIQLDLDLGTLATKVAILAAAGDTVTEAMYVSSVKAIWSLSGITIADNEGPILVGVAHSDYTGAEIEEYLENASNWAVGDLIAQEKAKRKIRRVGILMPPSSGLGQSVLNDGKPITTKCGWLISEGQTIDIWAYNLGTAALATTDPNVNIQGHANLWLR